MKYKVTGSGHYGFTKRNYAQLNLPSFCVEMIPSVDEERAVRIFYHDFSKALKKFSHGILVASLERCRLNGWTTAWREAIDILDGRAAMQRTLTSWRSESKMLTGISRSSTKANAESLVHGAGYPWKQAGLGQLCEQEHNREGL